MCNRSKQSLNESLEVTQGLFFINTYKNGYLYVFQMRPSKTVKIKTLKKHIPHDYLIESIELLGSDEKLNFTRDEKALTIKLKNLPDNDLPICFKMAIG